MNGPRNHVENRRRLSYFSTLALVLGVSKWMDILFLAAAAWGMGRLPLYSPGTYGSLGSMKLLIFFSGFGLLTSKMNWEIQKTLCSTFCEYDMNGASICWSKLRWFVKAEAKRWSVRLADGSNKLLKKENLEVKADASQGVFSLFCPAFCHGSLGDEFDETNLYKSFGWIFRLCFGRAVDAMMNHHRT